LQPITQQARVREIYEELSQLWGPQHWWPAHTRFEVIVGAYLTQNTAWTNVEKALHNLRAAGRLSLTGVRNASLPELESLIRPAGYFRQKARRLQTFVGFLDERYRGSLDRMFAQPTDKLRAELLALNGVGPETADSILLYAGNHPVFVIDAYTRRVVSRHEILPDTSDYEELRGLFERSLATVPEAEQGSTSSSRESVAGSGLRGAAHWPSPMSTAHRTPLVQVFNEMHGLLVGVGKHFCLKSQPRCDDCPLRRFLPTGA
jgi:endonuclease-3 related protein